MPKTNIVFIYQAYQGGETVVTENIITNLPDRYQVTKVMFEKYLNYSIPSKLKLLKYYSELIASSIKILWRLSNDSNQNRILVTTIIPLVALSSLFPKLKKTKIILTFHGEKHSGFWSELEKERNIIRKILYTFPIYLTLDIFEKVASKMVSLVIIPGKSAVHRLPKCFLSNKTSNIKIIENGVGSDFYPKKKFIINKKPKICFFGRLAPEKGVEELIQTFIKYFRNKYKLVLVCFPSVDKGYSDRIVKIIKYEANISLCLNPNRKIIPKILRNCDVGILPGKNEILSMSILESISTGTPVICSASGDLTDVMSSIDQRLILKSISIKEIANKINWYFSLPLAKKKVIYRNCVEASRKYHINKCVKKYDHVFNQIDRQ